MTEKAWMLVAALVIACLIGCWHRMEILSRRIDMLVIVQQSQQAAIDGMRQ